MSGIDAIQVTRSTLVRLVRRREQVDKGIALLRKKRDALVAQLFVRVRPGVDARRHIEQQAQAAYRSLVDALAEQGRFDLAALGWPSRELRIAGPGVLRGQAPDQPPDRVPDEAPAPPLVRSLAARGWVPGQAAASAAETAQRFEHLLELLLAAAPEEDALRRLGDELARTVRQVNVLEQRVVVDLRRSVARIRRTLDEREREEAVRLRRLAARES